MGSSISIEELATFCKKKGFVFPSSDIYGGLSGFFDFGPLGVELLKNIKDSFWKTFVRDKEFMEGIEASIISHPRTWKASGHLESFGDLILTCKKCNNKLRADHFIEDHLKINAEGWELDKINELIKENNFKCPKCKGDFEELKDFNLLFETSIGAQRDSSSKAYLRGETAQGMFMDFKQVAESSRQSLPFGIAQIGRCFRNEISPRDFLFRSREFHIAELEFFIHPQEKRCEEITKKHMSLKLNLLDEETQNKDSTDLKPTSIEEMVDKGRLGQWHAYWLAEQIMWLKSVGLSEKNLKIREHIKTELSFYSSATFDIDYQYPFGSKELAGNANRGQYDLTQHAKESGKKIEFFDEKTKEKVVPRVIEPTFGVERIFLAVLTEAFNDDKKRGNVVLNLDPSIAPFKAAVFPLVSNDKKIVKLTKQVFDSIKEDYHCFYDQGGSVGRRYARQDEVGTPFCITVDFDSLKDGECTIRDRDSTKQVRVPIQGINEILKRLLKGDKLDTLGKSV
jgi:glycyl-tRNA synthetase